MKAATIVFLILSISILSCENNNESSFDDNHDSPSGSIVFYTNAQAMLNCGPFDVDIFLNNKKLGSISKPAFDGFEPNCSRSQFTVLINQSAGIYTYKAKACGSLEWSDEIEVLEGTCTYVFLDINNFYQARGTFTDTRDGNVYDWVKIGTQVWMAENLAYLPSIVGPVTGSQTTPYIYVYGYDGTIVADAKSGSNYSTYGVLYNWPAAMNGEPSGASSPSGVQGVCPTGWHLPSEIEWSDLIDHLGGTSEASIKLKEAGNEHWNVSNTSSNNETGFTVLPGGLRHPDKIFNLMGDRGCFWSATEFDDVTAWGCCFGFMTYIDNGNILKDAGYSVRCLKD